ncbi:MAG: hypothetical protein R3B07_05340 [Polyangiaceae bacterium]
MRIIVACGVLGLLAFGCSAEERETGVASGGSAGSSAAGGSSGGSTAAGSGGDAGSAGSSTSGGSSAGGSSAGQGGSSGSAGSGGDAGTGAGGAAGGSAGMGGSAGTGAVTCTGNCLPPAPSGWSGPVAMYEGNTPPACVGDFAGTALTAKSQFEIGQSHCACDCDPPTGVSCESASICKVSNCNTLCLPDYTVSPNTCASGGGPGTFKFSNTPKYTSTGGCQPRATTTIDPSGFRNDVVACDMADPGGTCNGGAVCTPKLGATFQSACVIQAGDVACPAGPYSVKVTTYAGFTDDRRCTTCTCGGATGKCNAEIALVSSCSSLPILYNTLAPGECKTVSSGTPNLDYSVNPQGSCPPSAPGTTGEAKPTGAATLCCLQPN